MTVNDNVVITGVFAPFFTGTYTVIAVEETTNWLNDSNNNPVESAFDDCFLEKIN